MPGFTRSSLSPSDLREKYVAEIMSNLEDWVEAQAEDFEAAETIMTQ
jgi:hypothetical protein